MLLEGSGAIALPLIETPYSNRGPLLGTQYLHRNMVHLPLPHLERPCTPTADQTPQVHWGPDASEVSSSFWLSSKYGRLRVTPRGPVAHKNDPGKLPASPSREISQERKFSHLGPRTCLATNLQRTCP